MTRYLDSPLRSQSGVQNERWMSIDIVDSRFWDIKLVQGNGAAPHFGSLGGVGRSLMDQVQEVILQSNHSFHLRNFSNHVRTVSSSKIMLIIVVKIY